jgi:hypothetical protein
MLIADADRLKKHFENVVDVKLFTVHNILTIIDTFSIEIPDSTKLILPRQEAKGVVYTNLERIMNFKTTKKSGAQSEVKENGKEPD